MELIDNSVESVIQVLQTKRKKMMISINFKLCHLTPQFSKTTQSNITISKIKRSLD